MELFAHSLTSPALSITSGISPDFSGLVSTLPYWLQFYSLPGSCLRGHFTSSIHWVESLCSSVFSSEMRILFLWRTSSLSFFLQLHTNFTTPSEIITLPFHQQNIKWWGTFLFLTTFTLTFDDSIRRQWSLPQNFYHIYSYLMLTSNFPFPP